MIAMEKPRATITNSALIFLLDMFLIALVKAPNSSTRVASDPDTADY
jgi:hypothetical protein